MPSVTCHAKAEEAFLDNAENTRAELEKAKITMVEMNKAQEEEGSYVPQIKMSMFKIHVSFRCSPCKGIFDTRDKFKEHQRYYYSSCLDIFLVQVKVCVIQLLMAFIQCQHAGTLRNCAIKIIS